MGITHDQTSAEAPITTAGWDAGHAVTVIEATEQSEPSTPSTGTSLLYPKSDGRWYSKGDDGVEHGPFDEGGAPAGEKKPWDVAANYPLHADGDEFDYTNFTDFNAVWSLHNMTSSDFWFPGGSLIEAIFSPGDFMYIPIPADTNYEVVFEVAMNAYHNGRMIGPTILNTSGDGHLGCANYDGSTGYMIRVQSWAYTGLANSITGATTDGRHVWTTLKKNGSNYQHRQSSNGTSFGSFSTSGNFFAVTPAYVGFGASYSNGGEVWMQIHRMNIYATEFTP